MRGTIRTERRTPTELYRLYDANDRLLYIGISSNPQERLRSHAMRPPTGRTWWPDVAYCTLEWFPRGHLALDAEVNAIRSENPLHNKRSAVARA